MTHPIRIYTLWANLPGDDAAPWMIACEDEFCWEGDPSRCESKFEIARTQARQSGFEVREIVLVVEYDNVIAPFRPSQVAAEVSETGP